MKRVFPATTCACDHLDHLMGVFGDELPEWLEPTGEPMFVIDPSLIFRRTRCLFRWHCGRRMNRIKQIRSFRCRRCDKAHTLEYRAHLGGPTPVVSCALCGHAGYIYPSNGNWGSQ